MNSNGFREQMNTMNPLIPDEWMEKYNALVAFGEEHGHCNATYRHSVAIKGMSKPFKLGCFVVVQRKDFAMGKLEPAKMELLQKLVDEGKFDWAPLTVSVRSDRTWPSMFQILHEYCSNHPRKPVTSIPESLIYKNHEGVPIKLGRWMHTQNKLHRNQKLRADRVERFQNELINTGIFTWPVTRGSRAYTNRPPEVALHAKQHHLQQNNMQHAMNQHNPDPTLLLNKNNLHPLTGEVYSSGTMNQQQHMMQHMRPQQHQQQQQQLQHMHHQQQQLTRVNINNLAAFKAQQHMMQQQLQHQQLQQQQQHQQQLQMSGNLNALVDVINDDSSVSSNDQ